MNHLRAAASCKFEGSIHPSSSSSSAPHFLSDRESARSALVSGVVVSWDLSLTAATGTGAACAVLRRYQPALASRTQVQKHTFLVQSVRSMWGLAFDFAPDSASESAGGDGGRPRDSDVSTGHRVVSA
eukprot:2148704-Rhodomonas_salina.2